MELHASSAEQLPNGPLGAYLRVGGGEASVAPAASTNRSYQEQTSTSSAKDVSMAVGRAAEHKTATSSECGVHKVQETGGPLEEDQRLFESRSKREGSSERNYADDLEKEGLRPTVVRVKRRRTESPLDALMLEVATRNRSDQALDQAIARLAMNEQHTSRKLFRRIETVSEADLRERTAGASILQRLSKPRQQTDSERPDDGMPAGIETSEGGSVESFVCTPSQATEEALNGRSESGVEQKLDARDLRNSPPSPDLDPVFEAATENGARKTDRWSPAKDRLDRYARSKEEVLGDDLRRTRQQDLLTSARAGRLEAASAARYEQVRVRREASDPMGELFRLYDVIRVDDDEGEKRAAQRAERNRAARAATGRRALLMNYMPLLREVLPNAAAQVASPATWQDDDDVSGEDDDMGGDDVSGDGDDYVYDVYALEDGATGGGEREDELPPVIRVADDLEMRPTDEVASDYDSEDSNDENNPDNDYPEDEFGGGVDVASEASSQDDSDVDVYEHDDEEYDVTAYDEDDSDDEGVGLGRASSAWAIRR